MSTMGYPWRSFARQRKSVTTRCLTALDGQTTNIIRLANQGGARLARTLTIFANCKAYNIDPYKYLCDVFRRIKTTAKDQLVNLVVHKWQPQMAPAIY